MIIWFVSLVWASLIFGGHVDASHHMGMRSPQATITPPPATATSVEAPAVTSDPAAAFFQTEWSAIENVTLGQNAILDYIVPNQLDESVVLVLCQTNATGADSLTASNTWSVAQVKDPCIHNGNGVCTFDVGVHEQVNVTFEPGSLEGTQNLTSFFLCFGTPPADNLLTSLTCESYSPFFNIAPAAGGAGGMDAGNTPLLSTPTTPLRLPSHTAVVDISGAASLGATPTFATYSTGYVTVSASTTSPAPTETVSSSATSVAHTSKPSLSTGALVGIIVGAVGGALILALLGLLCLRRRKRTRSNYPTKSNTFDSTGSQPEHVLLTQPYSSIGSRDLIAEKDSPTTLASMLETPLSRPTLLPQNPRHSYDSLNASAPYSGLAAAAPKPRSSLPPSPSFPNQNQNQSQSQSQSSHQQSLLSHSISEGPFARSISDALASGPLSRGLSNSSHSSHHSHPQSLHLNRNLSSASGPISPRTVSTVRGEAEEFEEYHDVPIYGDARHTPTVYESHPSLLQAPFLSEEGMSAEEIARLEEEERRIDAAIAAAEAGGGGRR